MVVGDDYDKCDNNMKVKEPTICKKFRRIFRNAGYKTYLINEFRTSKLCNYCNEEIEKAKLTYVMVFYDANRLSMIAKYIIT